VAHPDYWRSELPAEEWLLIESPTEESEPTKYWLATLSADAKLAALVELAKHRFRLRYRRVLTATITSRAACRSLIR
jgi:SRSO17 transposase